MKICRNSIIFFLAAAIYLTGCAKSPEKIQSPSIKIDVEILDNQESYLLRFSGGIRNENNSTAFTDFKGEIQFIDPGKDDKIVYTEPFSIPVILPFDTAILELEVKKTEKEILPLMELLNINKEKLMDEENSTGTFIEDKNINLEILSYNKKDIVNLLEEKINEKD